MLTLADIYFQKVIAVFMLPYCRTLNNGLVKSSEIRQENITLSQCCVRDLATQSCQNASACSVVLGGQFSTFFSWCQSQVHTGVMMTVITWDGSMTLRSSHADESQYPAVISICRMLGLEIQVLPCITKYYLGLQNQMTWALDPGSKTCSSVTLKRWLKFSKPPLFPLIQRNINAFLQNYYKTT